MNCDPIARWYRALEHLGMGRALERRRFEFLPRLADGQTGAEAVRRALLLGDGDGRFLEALLRVNATIQIDSIDNSGKMLALARARAVREIGREQAKQRIRFRQVDARGWLPPPGCTYDLVVTHFFLDCLSDAEVASLLDRLMPALARDAVWIVSEFNQPARGFPAWRARLWIGGLYRAFGSLTGLRVRRLPDHRAALTAHEFGLEQQTSAEWGLLASEWWQRSCKARRQNPSQEV